MTNKKNLKITSKNTQKISTLKELIFFSGTETYTIEDVVNEKYIRNRCSHIKMVSGLHLPLEGTEWLELSDELIIKLKNANHWYKPMYELSKKLLDHAENKLNETK